MTRERKLAIIMWEEIVWQLKYRKLSDVEAFKEKFCRIHNLNWENSCYFCQYYKCERCPIINCLPLYYKVLEELDVKSAERLLSFLKEKEKQIKEK